jgi:hypothetical protein
LTSAEAAASSVGLLAPRLGGAQLLTENLGMAKAEKAEGQAKQPEALEPEATKNGHFEKTSIKSGSEPVLQKNDGPSIALFADSFPSRGDSVLSRHPTSKLFCNTNCNL